MWELVWSILQQIRLGLGRGEAVSERRVQTFLGFLEGKEGVSGASGLRERQFANWSLSQHHYLTAPENIGCGVPGRGLRRPVFDFEPLGRSRGVLGRDMISLPS